MVARAFVAAALALFVAIQVVRDAAVRAVSRTAPPSAERIWPDHPDVQVSRGMIEIAAAARDGRPVGPSVFEAIYGASVAAPLLAEPFLVRGVQAQLAGDRSLAEQAFLEARRRDGRSLPAHYFLADHYLRQRDAAKGLREVAILSRLVPDGLSKLSPYVAQYAADPDNARQLRTLFRIEPELEASSLSVLATDARNADLVLSLVTPERRNAKNGWAPLLIGSLIQDRQYARARRIWAELSGIGPDADQLIYDPQFVRPNEPPPFNWTLNSSTVGLTERQRGGGLHVIYYGQESGLLASQLLTLSAGTYRLTTRAPGASNAELLQWTLICAPTNTPIASIPLDRAIRSGWRFTVPAECAAQRLELGGTPSDSPQPADLTLQGLGLDREQAHD